MTLTPDPPFPPPSPPDLNSPAAAAGPLARWNPYAVLAVGLAVSLLAAPVFSHDGDVFDCWDAWAKSSGGTRPWDIYRTQSLCNYPPVLLYLWTASAAVMRALPGLFAHRWAVRVLFKLPNIVAFAAVVPLCDRGLRRAWGAAPARAAAVAYALCVPMVIDAAFWGQYDAILCLAMIGCLVALIQRRPGLAGVLGGLAIGVKFQAIVIVPAAAAYAVRRLGVRATAVGLAAAAGVLVAVSAPFVVAGQGGPMRAAYGGAVDYYPVLTIHAANVWQPVRMVNLYVRHLPQQLAVADDVRWFGPITPKRVGLAMLGGYTAALLAGLWRRPDGPTLVRAAGLTAFAFFMLPTQMHERYVVPAAAILAVTAGLADRRGRASNLWLYAALTAVAAVHVAVGEFSAAAVDTPRAGLARGIQGACLVVLTLIDVPLLAWALARYLRDAWQGPPATPATGGLHRPPQRVGFPGDATVGVGRDTPDREAGSPHPGEADADPGDRWHESDPRPDRPARQPRR